MELTYYSKFISAGISDYLYEEICPELPSRLWLELDVVPMIFAVGKDYNVGFMGHRVDELADSMARKCIMCVPLVCYAERD